MFPSANCYHRPIYTGQQKKGYKVICLLFYKIEWHILFAYCKHNVCCLRVDLPHWTESTEAKLRHVSLNGFARLARYLEVCPVHDVFSISSTSRCWRYRVNIGTLSYLVYIFDIAMLTISCLYRVNIVNRCNRWPVIPCKHRSHRRHRDVDYIVSISCIYWYPVILRWHR